MYTSYKIFFCAFVVLFATHASAQVASDTLKVDVETYERLFLEKNLSLLAQQMSVAQEEALLIQEKIWNNPSLSISDVNFWTPNEEASIQQFEVALETLIQTAGKRKHRIHLQKLSGQMAVKEYEDLLRKLRREVRSQLAELLYFQEILPIYKNLNQNIAQILRVNKEQTEQRNYPREELLRLQTLALELTKEIFDIQQEAESLASKLKQYIQLEPNMALIIKPNQSNKIIAQFANLDLSALTEIEKRPDLQRFELQKEQAEAAIKLARAEAYPDLSLEASYNRFDGVWKDYIGFGVAFDLPIFNRNQGQIRFAKEEIKIQEIKQQQYRLEVQHAVEREYQKLGELLAIRRGIEVDYQDGLEDMLQLYTQDYKDRNINLLTFLDIQEAYLQGQDMLLSLEKEIVEAWEALQYQIGLEN